MMFLLSAYRCFDLLCACACDCVAARRASSMKVDNFGDSPACQALKEVVRRTGESMGLDPDSVLPDHEDDESRDRPWH